MVSKNPAFRAAFADGDIQDFDDQEAELRDKLTFEWWESLPSVKPESEGWKHFAPCYSGLVSVETMAFERWCLAGRLEFHSDIQNIFRLRLE